MPERMSHVYAKICGLRDPDHARVAIEAGAHAVGVVMNRTSTRRATEEEARTVIEAVDGRADTVLVVNDMPVAQAAALARRLEFDVLQLHGSAYGAADFEVALKKVDRVWRATSIDRLSSLQVGAYGEEHLLLDAPKPGSGERWDASALATDGPQGEWLLAGGLAPDNVAEIIRTVRPWGVDVSSGVEVAPGEKSVQLIREFLAAVAV